jgi:hypothetical protein
MQSMSATPDSALREIDKLRSQLNDKTETLKCVPVYVYLCVLSIYEED